MNSRGLALACLLLALLPASCGKKEPPPAPPAPQPSGGSVSSLLAPSESPPAAPTTPAASEVTAPPDPKPGELPDSNAIGNAVNAFLIKNHREARNLDELVAGGYLKVPPPPPGKKYLLNQRFSTLTVVDK